MGLKGSFPINLLSRISGRYTKTFWVDTSWRGSINRSAVGVRSVKPENLIEIGGHFGMTVMLEHAADLCRLHAAER
jgi:hypothetical protein